MTWNNSATNLFSTSATHEVTESWRGLSLEAKMSRICELLEKEKQFVNINIVKVSDFGSVYVSFTDPVGPSKRGTLLLDLEELLKREVDIGLNVWCQPIGDRNSLRNLRGIEIVDKEKDYE